MFLQKAAVNTFPAVQTFKYTVKRNDKKVYFVYSFPVNLH